MTIENYFYGIWKHIDLNVVVNKFRTITSMPYVPIILIFSEYFNGIRLWSTG